MDSRKNEAPAARVRAADRSTLGSPSEANTSSGQGGAPPADDRAARYEMAQRFGRVTEERSASGGVRWRIDCGTIEGVRVRIAGRPNPIHPTRVIPFPSRAAAELEHEYLRAAILAGATAAEAVAPYHSRQVVSALVESRAARYLNRWRIRVAQGKRSPTSLAELVRYAAPGGYWSWWYGRDIAKLSNRDVTQWQLWLGEQRKRGHRGHGERIGAKTQKNVCDAFRAFLRSESDDADGQLRVPRFPAIPQAEYAARTLSPDRLLAVLAAIPWARRGAYLAMAFEQLRVSEVVAHDLTDWDGEELHLHRGRKGHQVDAPIRENKTRSARRRRPWWPELVAWLEWRVAQASPADRLAGHACALFWNPTAENLAKRWGEGLLRRHWRRACSSVGVSIPLQEGTRHTVISRLAEVLSQAALQQQTRHASGISLAHYTVGARPDPVVMVHAIESRRDLEGAQGRPEPSGEPRRARKAGEIAGMPGTCEAVK